MKKATFAILLALISASALGAVFQYSVPVETSRGEQSAFLWVPPEAGQIRGVVMAGMTLMEREFAKDKQIRSACAEQQLAIIFMKTGLGSIDVQKVLDGFAKVSGYRELAVAPLMFIGHSAGGPQAKARATEMAARCFGLVQYRGGTPRGDPPVPAGVPVLMMIGQFDEFGDTMRDEEGRENWEGGRDAMADFRSRNERNLGSIVVEPGAGHFAWSDRNAKYLALFIRKAAEACIPARWPADASEPIAVKELDYRKGWLTDLEAIRAPGGFAPAPYEDYRGDKARTSWCFDKEIAEATVAYHAGGFGKKDQFIRWKDPYWVDAGARFFFTTIEWVGDGKTFEVHPEYADVFPSQHNDRGPRWIKAGEPVGHSNAPIHIKVVGGPIAVVGPRTFRIQYDALAPAGEGERATFMAFSEGDGEYRYTEHVGMLPRGFRGLTKGEEQTITFPKPANLKVGGVPVELNAKSDSGLPIQYYVAYGPAEIIDGKLRIAELPRKAKFPIEVKVVACQFGSGIEPLFKTATPAEQTLHIERP